VLHFQQYSLRAAFTLVFTVFSEPQNFSSKRRFSRNASFVFSNVTVISCRNRTQKSESHIVYTHTHTHTHTHTDKVPVVQSCATFCAGYYSNVCLQGNVPQRKKYILTQLRVIITRCDFNLHFSMSNGAVLSAEHNSMADCCLDAESAHNSCCLYFYVVAQWRLENIYLCIWKGVFVKV
jgi:hypothetical protein